MSGDESSDLSSVPSEDELDLQLSKKDGILKFFSKAPKPAPTTKIESPPRPKREASPPHEYVLADNPDIAFIVMFRSRFTEAFPKSLAHFGPQELERDIVDIVPGEQVEHFLCALLGLLLNRKQDVKSGHYNRALEEAVQTHKSQWAKDWESKNPLSGGATFSSMSPSQRLTLLRTLILWALSSSDVVKGIITTSYKQSRHEDDLNQPLSVQAWGSDADRRRYFLIEGLDDTHFRVYRESNYTGIKRTWWSVASDIDELKQLAERLATEDGGQKARVLSAKMIAAIPRFEATEEKRKRREYRQARKQQFKRPEPNFSLYEGRTRGKRMKYTYSDEEEESYSDATTSRRSTRNTGTHTPAEGLAPTVTMSGRQVKSRHGGAYGESMLSGTHTPAVNEGGLDRAVELDVEDDEEMVSDDNASDDYGDDEVSLESGDQDELTEVDDEVSEISEDPPRSLVVKLPVKKTPTPERKITLKIRLTPEKEAVSSYQTKSQPSSDLNPKTLGTENDHWLSALPTSSGDLPLAFEHAAETANVRTRPSMNPNPQSPLAFRDSPEKPHNLPPSIDVYGGS